MPWTAESTAQCIYSEGLSFVKRSTRDGDDDHEEIDCGVALVKLCLPHGCLLPLAVPRTIFTTALGMYSRKHLSPVNYIVEGCGYQ